MDTRPAIVVDHLRIAFGNSVAVQDLSFSLAPGKTLAIIGASGSGESLIGRALTGLLPIGATWCGTIHLNNTHITPATPQRVWQNIRGRIAGMVPEHPMRALDPLMKIGRQLSEAIQINAGLARAEARTMAIEWLYKAQIPSSQKAYHKYPHQLSAGQKQRVMMAMALSASPALLIFDEPTSALDVSVQAEMIRLIRSLQQAQNTAFVFLTHDIALAMDLADDVLVLSKGEVLEYGATDAVLSSPEHPYTRALLACRPGATEKGYRLPALAELMQGEAAMPPLQKLQDSASQSAGSGPLLKVRNLRVWFPRSYDWLGTPQHFLRAVEDVSFDLMPGEVLGLIGENGCGKSTISRALIGLQTIESGQIFFQGQDLVHMSAAGWRRMRREIQVLLRDPFSSLNPRLTVGEAIMEPLRAHQIVPRKEFHAEAKRLMELVHLPSESLQRYPHQFSRGECQRIGMARAIALRPKLIICDESLSALDTCDQAQMLNLLKDLQSALRLSYLFISHDLNIIRYVADRVLVMQSGRIIERGTTDEVFRHPKEDYTQKLIAAMPSL